MTSSKVYDLIRDWDRDRDCKNALYESETETETLKSHDTSDESLACNAFIITQGKVVADGGDGNEAYF